MRLCDGASQAVLILISGAIFIRSILLLDELRLPWGLLKMRYHHAESDGRLINLSQILN